MSKANNRQKLQTAFSLHQSGNLDEAANIYRQLIKSDPNNFHALHFLGVIEAGAGNYEQAKTLMARSLSIQPPNIQFIENYAGILFQAADYKSALQLCKQGLQLNDNNVSLLYVSAISLFKLNQLQDSLAQFERVLMYQPNHIAALNERGSVLAEMKTMMPRWQLSTKHSRLIRNTPKPILIKATSMANWNAMTKPSLPMTKR